MSDLIKTSIRSLRTPCDKCGAEGPFYAATDAGRPVLIVKNSYTRAASQGGTVARSVLHVCAPNGGVGTFASPDHQAHASDDAINAAIAAGEAHTETNVGDDDDQQGAQAAEETSGDTAEPAADETPSDDFDADAQAIAEILKKRSGHVDRAEVERIAREVAADVVGDIVMPEKTIVVIDAELREITGVTHAQFEDVMIAVKAGTNVQLVGGPGVGKTHMLEQIAEALGRGCYAVGFHLQSTASELKGYMSATGEYVATVVHDWLTNPDGGVLLADELDRSHPGIQAALNSLLSNRFMVMPDRSVLRMSDKHVLVAATNTFGDGPTAEFPAAMPFSAEFKDRFVAIEIEIDENIEWHAALAKGAPKDLTERAVAYVRKVRSAVRSQAISGVTVSPRASQNMAALLAHGMTWDKAVKAVLRKGMSDDVWRKVA